MNKYFQKRSQSQPRLSQNGWSLLNLTDIDKLQKPLYFSSAEEAERSRRAKRGGMGHKFSSQANLLNEADSTAPQRDNSTRLNIKWLGKNSS
jgi:hypothetical protein